MADETVEESYRRKHDKLVAGTAERSIIVPIGKSIPVRQRVLTDSQVRDILTSTGLIAVTNCDCRTTHHRCSSPLDVCIVVGDMARSSQGNPIYRTIGVEEALSILDRTSELGLVHMSIWAPGHVPQAICSCCPCCCGELRGVSEFGYPDYVARSDFVAALDEGRCSSCGMCVERCHFGAITEEGGSVSHAPERCFGCGLCAMTCPTGALTLSRRP